MAGVILKCSECGREFDMNLYGASKSLSKKMVSEQLCFDCAYWKHFIEHPLPSTLIISGTLCTATIKFGSIHGNLLRQRNVTPIRNIATGEIGVCIDYRKIAVIPARFHSFIPDQYRFITLDTYKRIKSWKGTTCRAKGCWDRYRCHWYNKETVECNKPWNKLPPGYYPGIEKCESFIDKETMYNVTV